MNEDSKHLKNQKDLRSKVGNLWLKYKESPIIYTGLLLILLILFAFIITNLIPGVRYGEYKGLKANEWLSFWGSLVLPLLLLVIPTATYLLNQKEINRKASAELRNEEWEKSIKLYEINKDDPDAAYNLFMMYEEALGADNIQRSRTRHHFLYHNILGYPDDLENEQELSSDVESKSFGNNSNQTDTSNQDSNLAYQKTIYYEDLITSMSEKGHSENDLAIITRFYQESRLVPYLQSSSIGKSTQIYSVLFSENKKRIGIMSVSSKSLYFKVGVGKKSFEAKAYKEIIDTRYDKLQLKPEFNSEPTESEGYLREPIKFTIEDLKDPEFFKATTKLMQDLCKKKFNN